MKMETLVKSRDCNTYEEQPEEQPISEIAPASQQVVGKAPWISIFLAQKLRIFRGKHNKLSFRLCFFLLLPDHKDRFTLSCCPKNMKKETWLRNLDDNNFSFFILAGERLFHQSFSCITILVLLQMQPLLKYLSALLFLGIRNHLRHRLLLTVVM